MLGKEDKPFLLGFGNFSGENSLLNFGVYTLNGWKGRNTSTKPTNILPNFHADLTWMEIYFLWYKRIERKTSHQKKNMNLAKLQYFTNLDFPEISGFPFLNATFWGPRSSEVAIIWPNKSYSTPQFRPASPHGVSGDITSVAVTSCRACMKASLATTPSRGVFLVQVLVKNCCFVL